MKKRTVKIAVAINELGDYAAYGGSGPGWKNPDSLARDALDSIEIERGREKPLQQKNIAVHWVEAEIPLPTTTKIKGKVKK